MQQAISKKIHSIRQKPQHIRERYLVLAMAVLTPIVLTIWYATFRAESQTRIGFVNSVVGNVKDTVNDTTYQKTFSVPSFEQLHGVPASLSPATSAGNQ
ncbi:MAG: hypothetical protein WCG55_01885 [bacterium]